jgi:outer membrane protein assembly factor BamE (lipoprotein component of BamABCDE complex)
MIKFTLKFSILIIAIILFTIDIQLIFLNKNIKKYLLLNSKIVSATIKDNKIELSNSPKPTEAEYIKKGISKDELIKIMGEPIDKLKGDSNKEVWYYGASKVFLENDKITSYDNYDGLLKVEETENESN